MDERDERDEARELEALAYNSQESNRMVLRGILFAQIRQAHRRSLMLTHLHTGEDVGDRREGKLIAQLADLIAYMDSEG